MVFFLDLYYEGFRYLGVAPGGSGKATEAQIRAVSSALGCESSAGVEAISCQDFPVEAHGWFGSRTTIRPKPVYDAFLPSGRGIVMLEMEVPDLLTISVDPPGKHTVEEDSFHTYIWDKSPPASLTIYWTAKPRAVLPLLLWAVVPTLLSAMYVVLVRWRAARSGRERWPSIWMMVLRYHWWIAFPVWLAAMGLGLYPAADMLASASQRPVLLAVATFLLFFLPGLASNLCFQLGVHNVMNRLKSINWPRGMAISLAFWRSAAGLGALSAGLVGLRLWHTISLGASTPAFLLGIVLLVAGSFRSRQIMGLSLSALLKGELKDRAFALAAAMRAPLQGIYLVPQTATPFVNAFAHGRNISVSEEMVRLLTRAELDTVLAHELAHVKYRHGSVLSGVVPFLLCAVIGGFAGGFFRVSAVETPFGLVRVSLIGTAILVFISVIVFGFFSRMNERKADRVAMEELKNPGAMVRALTKLHDANLLPISWARAESKLLSHPSLKERITAASKMFGATDEEARSWLSEEDGSGHYPLPTEMSDFGFTSKYRHRMSYWLFFGLPVVAALGGVLVAGAGAALLLDPVALTILVLAGGTLLRFIVDAIFNRIDRAVVRPLLKVDHSKAGAIPVGLAPNKEPLLYDGWFLWDRGFLDLEPGLFRYRGEQSEFTLRPDEVEALDLSPRLPTLWPYRHVFVRWRKNDSHGTFRLGPDTKRPLWGSRAMDAGLLRRIIDWKTEAKRELRPTSGDEAVSTGAGGLPPGDEVSGVHPAELQTSSFVTTSLFLPVLLAVLLGQSLGAVPGFESARIVLPAFSTVFAGTAILSILLAPAPADVLVANEKN